MAAKFPFMQWYTGDWLGDPAVSLCSPATRGIWADLLCRMHEAQRSGRISGTYAELARAGRCSETEMAAAVAELRRHDVADIEECNGVVTLINRRMHREAKARQKSKLRVDRHRGNAPVTPSVMEEEAETNAECNAPVTGHISYFRDQIDLSSRGNPPNPPSLKLASEDPPIDDLDDPANPLSAPGARDAYQRSLEAVEKWSAMPKPIGRGKPLLAIHNEHAAVMRLFLQFEQTSVPGRDVVASRLIPDAVQQLVAEGVTFKVPSYACGAIRNRLQRWIDGEEPRAGPANGPMAAPSGERAFREDW